MAVSDDPHLFGYAVFMFAVSILPSVYFFMLLIVTNMLVLLCGRNSVALPVSSGREFLSSRDDT